MNTDSGKDGECVKVTQGGGVCAVTIHGWSDGIEAPPIMIRVSCQSQSNILLPLFSIK